MNGDEPVPEDPNFWDQQRDLEERERYEKVFGKQAWNDKQLLNETITNLLELDQRQREAFK